MEFDLILNSGISSGETLYHARNCDLYNDPQPLSVVLNTLLTVDEKMDRRRKIHNPQWYIKSADRQDIIFKSPNMTYDKDRYVEHYRLRVKSSYQDYFEQRYLPFLNECRKHLRIKEEGIGIGSVSKALRKNDINCYGTDISVDMIKLCMENNPGLFCWQEDMLKRTIPDLFVGTTAIATHGVLEHLTDTQIATVLERYNNSEVSRSIHYVPTDKYKEPSIGDERLLSWKYWVETFKPIRFVLFNDQHDLMLVFKH